MRRHLTVLAFFILAAAVWSWPAPLLDPTRLPARHFDLWPVLWLLDRAPELGLDLRVAASAWPAGEQLTRLDSWVLLAVGKLLRPWLSATTIACLLAWLGPAVSAFAAERAAVVLGAQRPWSLAAGLAYGLSGVAASAALEGHIPHLLEPWLPLTLAAGWRAGQPGGKAWHGLVAGLLAGLGASLALLTTAYHGLIAALLLVVLTVRAGRNCLRFLPALVVSGATASWLAWLFMQGQGEQIPPRRVVQLAELGSASLSSLLMWTPAIDQLHHSVSAPLGGLLLAALLLGWRDRSSRWLLGLAWAGLLLSLGPQLRWQPGGAGLVSPLALLWDSPAGAFLRFPVRFVWLSSLCGGVVLARVLTRAASGLSRPLAASLLAVVLLDPFVATGMPGRQRSQPLPGQDLTGQDLTGQDLTGQDLAAAGLDLPPATGAVLDLFPVAAWPAQADIEMQARTRSCAAQIRHGAPIFTRCVGTSVADSRTLLSAWLLPRLMASAGPSPDLARRLAGFGVASVLVHRGSFRVQDLEIMDASLTSALGPPQLSTAELSAHRVPGAVAGAEPAAAALGRVGLQ